MGMCFWVNTLENDGDTTIVVRITHTERQKRATYQSKDKNERNISVGEEHNQKEDLAAILYGECLERKMDTPI